MPDPTPQQTVDVEDIMASNPDEKETHMLAVYAMRVTGTWGTNEYCGDVIDAVKKHKGWKCVHHLDGCEPCLKAIAAQEAIAGPVEEKPVGE